MQALFVSYSGNERIDDVPSHCRVDVVSSILRTNGNETFTVPVFDAFRFVFRSFAKRVTRVSSSMRGPFVNIYFRLNRRGAKNKLFTPASGVPVCISQIRQTTHISFEALSWL